MTSNILEGLRPLAEPIDSVTNMEGNPRRGDVASVARSLKRFGQHRPIVVQTSTKEILIGNHTHKAAKTLGWTEIAVVFTDDDRETAVARALADNRTHDAGTYDQAELAAMIVEAHEADTTLLIDAGFAEREVSDLLALAIANSSPDDILGELPAANPRPKAEPKEPAAPVQPEAIKVETIPAKARQATQFEVSDDGIGKSQLFIGNCLDVLADLPDACIDAVITDPIGGMDVKRSKNEGDEAGWWRNVPGPDFWNEISRVMKPGAHLAVLATPTTFHRLAVVVEDCDLPLRDTLMWMFTHCMPMGALDLGMEVDKVHGGDGYPYLKEAENLSDEERREFQENDENLWFGWSTALKPSWRPILLHRKAFAGSVIRNVMNEGVGGMNVDAARVGDEERSTLAGGVTTLGRWPANVILDGDVGIDVGEWARYFLSTGPTMKERSIGLPEGTKNDHPKVRPVDLMRWLVRLLTPPGGLILDPFCGSGSTGVAATEEGMAFIGIDRNERWITDIARYRLAEVEARRAQPPF